MVNIDCTVYERRELTEEIVVDARVRDMRVMLNKHQNMKYGRDC